MHNAFSTRPMFFGSLLTALSLGAAANGCSGITDASPEVTNTARGANLDAQSTDSAACASAKQSCQSDLSGLHGSQATIKTTCGDDIKNACKSGDSAACTKAVDACKAVQASITADGQTKLSSCEATLVAACGASPAAQGAGGQGGASALPSLPSLPAPPDGAGGSVPSVPGTDSASSTDSAACKAAGDSCHAELQAILNGVQTTCEQVSTACSGNVGAVPSAPSFDGQGGFGQGTDPSSGGSPGTSADCQNAQDACKAAMDASKSKADAARSSCESSLAGACLTKQPSSAGAAGSAGAI